VKKQDKEKGSGGGGETEYLSQCIGVGKCFRVT
jgi:hypothetical protein